MQRKLVITIDEHAYERLSALVGRRRISRFVEELIRTHLAASDLEVGYKAMAQDKTHEAEALEWAEGLISDVRNE